MHWTVIFHPECQTWFDELSPLLQDALFQQMKVLSEYGPELGRPRVDSIQGSTLTNLKELRIQYKGDPWRILFAFDPLRQAILLVGGNKQSDKRWYKTHISIAEKRFNTYLETLTHGTL